MALGMQNHFVMFDFLHRMFGEVILVENSPRNLSFIAVFAVEPMFRQYESPTSIE